MDFYSVWPFFVCIGLLLGFAATPMFSAADEAPGKSAGRLQTLDGLRGFAALAVVFHHALYYRFLLIDGRWGHIPSGHFYYGLGPAGVSIFFMVTGYLFWSRLIRDAGRPNWIVLYVGRIFRVTPLYLVAVLAMLAAAFVGMGGELHAPPSVIVIQALPWFGFGFLGFPEVNGVSAGYLSLLLAGVLWTLHAEWLFYLSLPITALVARRPRAHLSFLLLALGAGVTWILLNSDHWRKMEVLCPTLFLLGMASASLQARRIVPVIPNAIASVVVIALLIAVFGLFPDSYSAAPMLMLGVVFYLISAGCTVFGMLTCGPARRLGDVSYGIYLLQGLVLAAVLRPEPMRSFALSSPLAYWSMVLLCAALLVAVATVTYVLVERPGIALGRRVAASMSKTPATLPRAAG